MAQPPPYSPPGTNPPPAAMVSKVELSISCNGLRDADIFSKSDPLCVVFSDISGRLQEIGRTERIDDNLNPKFHKQIVMDYHFEEVQKLVFKVFDIDDNNNDISQADFLGKLECTLGQVVSSTNFTRALDYNGRDYGTITIHAQEQGGEQQSVHLTLKGVKLDKKDWFDSFIKIILEGEAKVVVIALALAILATAITPAIISSVILACLAVRLSFVFLSSLGKSDPFLEFHRQLLDGSYALAHRTEVKMKTLNPSWKPMKINSRRLCNNNPDGVIKAS